MFNACDGEKNFAMLKLKSLGVKIKVFLSPKIWILYSLYKYVSNDIVGNIEMIKRKSAFTTPPLKEMNCNK